MCKNYLLICGTYSRRPSTTLSSPPSPQPTGFPSHVSSVQPSRRPSATPSSSPSPQPTGFPIQVLSVQPSRRLSATPSSSPSPQPTGITSQDPSVQPSRCVSARFVLSGHHTMGQYTRLRVSGKWATRTRAPHNFDWLNMSTHE